MAARPSVKSQGGHWCALSGSPLSRASSGQELIVITNEIGGVTSEGRHAFIRLSPARSSPSPGQELSSLSVGKMIT